MGILLAGADWGVRLASFDILGLIGQAGWLVKLVLLLLAATSVFSWAIIVSKWRELRRAEEDSGAFLERYHEGSRDAAYEAARSLAANPLSAIYLEGYAELKRISHYAGRAYSGTPDEFQREALGRVLNWTAGRENHRLERGLSFLATTGSAAPFVGLFGTVVGIIDAFQGIAASGSASLAVVAPGIAEALIATAVGLAAAIPATIAYNYFVGRLTRIGHAIELFTVELQSDLARGNPRAAPEARATRA